MHKNTLYLCFCIIEVNSGIKAFLLNVNYIKEFCGKKFVFYLCKKYLFSLYVKLYLPRVLSILRDPIVLCGSRTFLIFFIFLLTYKNNFARMNVLLVQKVHEVTALLLVLTVKVLFYNLL